MKHVMLLPLILLAAALPACATAKAGFGLVQGATKDARVWTHLDGKFDTNANLTEWAYLDGTGTYEVGIQFPNPLGGAPLVQKALKGSGSIRTGWHLRWNEEAGKPVLETVGYETAHAALGDPPAVP